MIGDWIVEATRMDPPGDWEVWAHEYLPLDDTLANIQWLTAGVPDRRFRAKNTATGQIVMIP